MAIDWEKEARELHAKVGRGKSFDHITVQSLRQFAARVARDFADNWTSGSFEEYRERRATEYETGGGQQGEL